MTDTWIIVCRVAREFDGIIVWRSKPTIIDSDNRTELTSSTILKWEGR